MKRKTQVYLVAGAMAGIVLVASVYFLTMPMPPIVEFKEMLEGEVAALLEERLELDETVWAQEVAAQKHEETIVKYWDRMLRPEDDKYAVLAEFPFETITLDAPGETTEIDWGIKRTTYEGLWKTLDRKGWREFLREMEDGGYGIDSIEFHQSAFTADAGEKAVSVFNVLLNVANEKKMQRWTVNTKLRIEWTEETDGDGHYLPGELTVFDTKILERQGATVFKHRVLQAKIKEESCPVVYDLNRDGLSDILLPSNDIVMWNLGDGQFDNQKLFTAPGFDAPISVYTAIVADFDRDGYVDLLCSGQYKERASTHPSTPQAGLFLFRGDAKGNFVRPGERVASPAIALSLPVCVTAGDIDGDGDLDVWLAQYKNAYREGSMPTPFYDANDGYPSYLLVNRGNGIFDDMTEAAGLAPKRHRRTFAASFVDLDEDLDLDLLVSSDYAGTDIHINSGTGHFTDETDAMLKESANFGMGHTFGDYDQDGALDFYVLGMASTTMRRLNQMGLIRPDRPEYLEMRTRMGYGSRMYLARDKRTFRQPEFRDSVARSGWSWGATSFDFDNDGDIDLYVANGNRSGKTTKDYCTQFWCHDIYTGGSQRNPVVERLFETTLRPLNERYSWDGYQKNHLFMNLSGEDFVNVAFLMNAALVEDSRCVISDDFNGDGRLDLLLTSRTIDFSGGANYDTLHLLTNHWPIQNNWIGVRLQIEAGGPSSIGAVIRVRSNSTDQLAHIVTGDSYRAQHAPMKHFGLGTDTRVDALEVRWPDGSINILKDPAINTYHIVSSRH